MPAFKLHLSGAFERCHVANEVDSIAPSRRASEPRSSFSIRISHVSPPTCHLPRVTFISFESAFHTCSLPQAFGYVMDVPHFSLVDKWSNQLIGAFAMWMAQVVVVVVYTWHASVRDVDGAGCCCCCRC